jgi:predicted esterase YcpF (UPF0227 family)
MKKILYLHGLESSNVGDKVDFLKERAIVLAPSIDYRKSNIEEELMYMVESFQPDLIIGSSMGGYAALNLGNYFDIPVIAILCHSLLAVIHTPFSHTTLHIPKHIEKI